MNVVGVIPARYSSTRFEGKVLAAILDKPMIQHVWERAKQARLLDDLIIACDNEQVAQVAREFAAHVEMTSRDHACGTDRISEVVNPLEAKIIVNIQGDEPLIQPSMIDALAQELLDHSDIALATIVKKIDDPGEINDPNVVKVIIDKHNFALYFSRAAIPYLASNSQVQQPVFYKHIGMYAYTKDFLFTYRNLPVSRLEKTECLEQLRVLEEGFRIKVIETQFETVGVDRPEDLKKVEKIMKQKKWKK